MYYIISLYNCIYQFIKFFLSAYLFCLLTQDIPSLCYGCCPQRVDNVLSQEGWAFPHKMKSLVLNHQQFLKEASSCSCCFVSHSPRQSVDHPVSPNQGSHPSLRQSSPICSHVSLLLFLPSQGKAWE